MMKAAQLQPAVPPSRLHTTVSSARRSASSRRGTAYIMVICTGLLLSAIGMGVLTSTRATARSATAAADAAEAATLAESGVQWGLAAIKGDTGWRTSYTSGVAVTPRTLGRGSVSFSLVDETDGDLSNNTSDTVRLQGIGRAGSAVRVYSVGLSGSGPPLDSLKNAIQAGGALTISGTVSVSGGPMSANGTLTLNTGAAVTGDLEATAYAGAGGNSGARATLTTNRNLPVGSVFDNYKSLSTEIAYASIASGAIASKVISGTTNPYGSPNANGVYYIKVPSTGNLTIRSSRLVCTLVVELEPGGKITTGTNPWAWATARSDYPALIVKGTSSSSSVNLGGSTSTLRESLTLVNFNPPGAPDPSGVTDNDKTDTYTTQMRGLVHVIGSNIPVNLSNSFNLYGAIIADGPIMVGNGSVLTADPVLQANAPAGYTTASDMIPTPSSWRWEAAP